MGSELSVGQLPEGSLVINRICVLTALAFCASCSSARIDPLEYDYYSSGYAASSATEGSDSRGAFFDTARWARTFVEGCPCSAISRTRVRVEYRNW